MTNKILTLASEVKDLHSKWLTLSIYERFEQTVVAVLTLVIAVIIALAGWQLLLSTLRLAGGHLFNPADPLIFQRLFGMVLTVLIALEFKHTLLVVSHHRRAIVQVRAVVLIALLALVRRFIILDLYQPPPGSDRSPGRRRFGPRNCILACRQLRTSGRRWGAGVTFATPDRDGVQAGSYVICFARTPASTKGEIMKNAREPVQTRLLLRTFSMLLNKRRSGFSQEGPDEANASYPFLLHSSYHPQRRAERSVSTRLLLLTCLILITLCPPGVSFAQPVTLSPPQLDQLVARIALYPDPLLANILTASTYWNEIPEAAAWADQHSYLKGDALAQAIQADHLQWDPSVLALLPFPSVLEMMARDPAWTEQLGDAALTQNADVMDAVQRMRQRARNYGYLTTNGYINVIATGGYIQILPVNPDVLYVPYYDPLVVFAPPRPGFAIAGAIRFGPGITIGAVFGGWGWWLGSGFVWPSHTILIDRRPWGRVWVNRAEYVHPYVHPWVRPVGPRVETHRLRR